MDFRQFSNNSIPFTPQVLLNDSTIKLHPIVIKLNCRTEIGLQYSAQDAPERSPHQSQAPKEPTERQSNGQRCCFKDIDKKTKETQFGKQEVCLGQAQHRQRNGGLHPW